MARTVLALFILYQLVVVLDGKYLVGGASFNLIVLIVACIALAVACFLKWIDRDLNSNEQDNDLGPRYFPGE